MDKKQTAELLAIIKAAYSQVFKPEDPAATLNIWADMMQDVESIEARGALRRILGNRASAFAPTIGEIRREVIKARYPSLLISGEEAWGEVRAAIRTHGQYRRPEWSFPAIESAVESIGWPDICLTASSDYGTLRAQFMRIYESRRSHEEERLATPEAIRINPPRPAAPRLNQTHSTPAIETPRREELSPPEEESDPETFSAGIAMVMAAIGTVQNMTSEPTAQITSVVEMTDEQSADPDYLPEG